jgi:hypothetical protein
VPFLRGSSGLLKILLTLFYDPVHRVSRSRSLHCCTLLPVFLPDLCSF